MSTLSRDFKPRRTPPPVGPRKIPVLRLLVLAAVLFIAIKHRSDMSWQVANLFSRSSSLLGNIFHRTEPASAEGLTRKERMSLAGGKVWRLPNGLLQESWRLQDSARLSSALELYSNPMVGSVIRALVDAPGRSRGGGVLELLFAGKTSDSIPRFARFRDSLETRTIVWMPSGVYLQAETRCVWLEECPSEPLEGGAVPIGLDFDFEGREHLLTHDLFRGIGESPVYAVLAGVVERAVVDSVRGRAQVRILHENNQSSHIQELGGLAEGIRKGARVGQGDVIGRMPALDTAELVFQFQRNGKFVRWDEIKRESRPVADSVFATFLDGLLK